MGVLHRCPLRVVTSRGEERACSRSSLESVFPVNSGLQRNLGGQRALVGVTFSPGSFGTLWDHAGELTTWIYALDVNH